MKILCTGGLGFIGSHTAVELINKGHEVVIADNLSNSSIEVKDCIEKITGKKVKFYQIDLCDYEKLDNLFKVEHIDATIHFAGFKAVGESVAKPLMYYENNLLSTINLLKCMQKYNSKNLIFSSSATVYGRAEKMPITEDFPLSATNPYGRTKLMIEEMLGDVYKSDPEFNIVILRYFNPVGAHKSGLIGENPNGIPNNLMPYITKVALGELPELNVFGNDYHTKDGTGVRDYIHILDLANGHVMALKKLEKGSGLNIYNIGTGNGYSVLEMVNAYNKVCDNGVKYKIAPRRAGDVDICYASPEKAEKEIGFKAVHGLDEMCEDSYRFGKLHFKK